MGEAATLKIVVRKIPNKIENKKLKREGYYLGNISGRRKESIAIAVKKDEFRRVLKSSKGNRLYHLEGDDKSFHVRLKELQIAHTEVDLSHIDFQLLES